jgi:cobalt-zinc-cadmium efflux system protein
MKTGTAVGHDHHHHHHHHGETGRVLTWSLGLTIAFVAIEAFFGVRAGSLALLSDAGHNFTDALALALAGVGVYVQARPADEHKTYGYHRAGVLAAFVNALTLLVLSGFIFWESYARLRHPQPVQETIMLWVATAGVAVNGVIMWGLHRRKEGDINIRAAWIHMFGDMLGSLGIIVGAIAIRFTGWTQIDPILSVAIGALIIWTAWDVIKESLNVLLEALPAGMNLNEVSVEMRKVEGVLEVHDLHIWTLGLNNHALSCHVLIEDQPHSSSEAILQRVNAVLHRRFSIHHTTIQLEHAPCALSESGCSMDGTNCCN